jgi:WD40 repeat protein
MSVYDVAAHRPYSAPGIQPDDGAAVASADADVSAVAFSPDGTTVAYGTDSGVVRLYDVRHRRPLGAPLAGRTGAIWILQYGHGGTTLFAGTVSGTIAVWRLPAGATTNAPLTGHTGVVVSIAFTPDGQTLVSGSVDGTVRLWSAAGRQTLGQPLNGAGSAFVALSRDGTLLAAGGSGPAADVWQLGKTPKELFTAAADSSVTAIAISPDGRTLAVEDAGYAGAGATIQLWDLRSHAAIGAPLPAPGTIAALSCPAGSIAFSPDGKLLVAADGTGSAWFWDVPHHRFLGKPLQTGLSDEFAVAFSPDGTKLAYAGSDEVVRMWDVALHRPVGVPLAGFPSFIDALAFSPDGKMVAAGGGDGTAMLWDTATGEQLGLPLTGPTEYVTSVAFSPDGQQLAAGSADTTVRLWNIGLASAPSEACRIAGRNLTTDEWRQYLGSVRYRPTCPTAG